MKSNQTAHYVSVVKPGWVYYNTSDPATEAEYPHIDALYDFELIVPIDLPVVDPKALYQNVA